MFSRYLELIRSKGQRSFTLKQAAKDLNLSENSIKLAIVRLKKRGDIISPARGLYIIIPPENKSQGCLPAEELVPLLFEYLGVNYYAGLLTAAMYHGATHQKPGRFQIVVDRQIKRRLQFGKVRIDCIYKKSFKHLPMQNLTVSTGYLTISSPEVTVMDLLLYPRRSGGLNHIATVLCELIESLDLDKLMALAQLSSQHAWIQRLGYILEQIESEDPNQQQSIIDALAQYLGKITINYVALASEMPTVGCPRSEKWKIIENTTIESDI